MCWDELHHRCHCPCIYQNSNPWYNPCLLIKLTPKGIACSCLIFPSLPFPSLPFLTITACCNAVQVARLRCALARYLIWEVNASRDFRYQIRPSESMPYQPCLLQLSGMLKQAARDRQAASEERQILLEAIQSGGAGSAGRHHLALQVCHLTVATCKNKTRQENKRTDQHRTDRTERKRNETKRNERRRNESKQNKMKKNKTN